MSRKSNIDEILHGAEISSLEPRIMELALEHTGARSGAIFLWDAKTKALAVDFHVAEGVNITLPLARLRRRTDGRANGIAFHVLDTNRPHLSGDTASDPHYARYFFDASSVAAVPIPYQDRAIGVLSVSSKSRDAFGRADTEILTQIAGAAAKFLRRAQLARTSKRETGRPFVIKGLSPEWLEVERQIERVAGTSAPVLVHGESGTGKDLVARAIHFNSTRSVKPYIVVNCAAIPETLLESTLFGHVRGAFTGANTNKVGELEKAHGGTLFLDEIGEMSLPLQAKLLRALDQGEITPLGSNQPPRRVDVRLLCATHRDLDAMVRTGAFREDLYFRIRVVTLELPPLRAFKDNLEVLVGVFVAQAAQRHERPVVRMSPRALALLRAYDFPGNMRELRNIVEHAVIMCTGDEIGPADLPPSLQPAPAARAATPKHATLREMRDTWLHPLEHAYLTELLAACRGNVREACRRADVTAATLYRLMERRGVELVRVPRATRQGVKM
jgi:DNA-binding NtrC family response regulator